MHGLTLRVTMFPRPPTAVLVTRPPRNRLLRRIGYVGMDAWVLYHFAKKFNFTPVVLSTTDGSVFGYNVNGSYTGTLKDLVRASGTGQATSSSIPLACKLTSHPCICRRAATQTSP